MADYKVFTINPGSTSTKIGLFNGEKEVFTVTVEHDTAKLNEFSGVSDQLSYRRDTILSKLEENGASLDDVDAFVGRGGGLMAVDGGVYEINDILLDHAQRGANGIQHPAQLGPQLAREFAQKYDKPAFVVNPPDTDELCDSARMTGVKDVYRTVHLHALNLKETAIRYAASIGKNYEDCNFVVCHIGGGISVSAHQKGKMIDGNDIVGGEGPMAPTRCGSLPVFALVKPPLSDLDKGAIKQLCTRTGGFVSHLGTADAKEVSEWAHDGSEEAKRVWDAMLYQIHKWIGAMSASLKGDVEAILLGGGMVYSDELVASITEACSWIAPVVALPGEYELEAMAAGANRILNNQEEVKEYTGIPRWSGFSL